MDGLQLLQALRSNPTTQRTGFLLITGRADGTVIDRGRGLGMNNYIKKPFTPDDMRGAIEAVFGRL
jgi:two-component system chemotaxis response regulator CheY